MQKWFHVIARMALLALVYSLSTGSRAATLSCTPGSQPCPIVVQMPKGQKSVTYSGTLTQSADCCDYVFEGRKGQTFGWSLSGASARTMIRYPNGNVDGPGVPASLVLNQSGKYRFRVSPNLMADGAFGPFTLTISIK